VIGSQAHFLDSSFFCLVVELVVEPAETLSRHAPGWRMSSQGVGLRKVHFRIKSDSLDILVLAVEKTRMMYDIR
jgi:hypothetical protein